MTAMDIKPVDRTDSWHNPWHSATDPRPRQLRRAARYVASEAADAEDCAMLLDMLGLDARDGLGTGP